jgi:hypothetical protein
MQSRVWALGFATLVGGCMSTEPDYIAETRGACDPGSQLVRRGYPDNLDRVLAGQCTVTRTDQTRGPDFSAWLANGSSAITDCDSPIRIPFWTEKSADGKITVVHFCADYCMALRTTLLEELKKDVACTDQPVAAGSSETTPQPSAAGAGSAGVGAPAMAGSAAPAAGSGGSS